MGVIPIIPQNIMTCKAEMRILISYATLQLLILFSFDNVCLNY